MKYENIKYKGDSTWSDYYIYQLRNINYSTNGLEDAMRMRRLDKVIILLTAGYRPDDRSIKLANPDLDIIKYFIEHEIPIDINIRMILAIRHGNIDIVKYLVERGGADIHFAGDRALRMASHEGHLEIVKYLVEHGAIIDFGSHYAVKKLSAAVPKYLSSYRRIFCISRLPRSVRAFLNKLH